MKKDFNSTREFAEHLNKMIFNEAAQLHKGLKAAAKLIEKSAKSEFGTYQDSAGPFDEWKELADATKKDRVNKNFPENEPLLRTGALRDSITHQVEHLEAAIGSDSDIMIYQELGTKTIPPRPVLGPAAFRNKNKIQKIIAHAAVAGVMGRQYIYEPGALGNDEEPPEL